MEAEAFLRQIAIQKAADPVAFLELRSVSRKQVAEADAMYRSLLAELVDLRNRLRSADPSVPSFRIQYRHSARSGQARLAISKASTKLASITFRRLGLNLVANVE